MEMTEKTTGSGAARWGFYLMGLLILAMGLTLTLGWKRFTRDEDIREIETANAFRNQLRERRNQKHHLFEFKTEE